MLLGRSGGQSYGSLIENLEKLYPLIEAQSYKSSNRTGFRDWAWRGMCAQRPSRRLYRKNTTQVECAASEGKPACPPGKQMHLDEMEDDESAILRHPTLDVSNSLFLSLSLIVSFASLSLSLSLCLSIKNTCILWSHRSKLASLWTIKILNSKSNSP